MSQASLGVATESNAAQQNIAARLASLDAFRGATMDFLYHQPQNMLPCCDIQRVSVAS
jgi:hypothetical protein